MVSVQKLLNLATWLSLPATSWTHCLHAHVAAGQWGHGGQKERVKPFKNTLWSKRTGFHANCTARNFPANVEPGQCESAIKKKTKKTFMLACSWTVSENYHLDTALEYLFIGSQMLSILLMEIRYTLCIGQWLRGMTFYWALEKISCTVNNKLDKFWKLWNMFSNFLKNSNTSTDGSTYDGRIEAMSFLLFSFLFSICFFVDHWAM